MAASIYASHQKIEASHPRWLVRCLGLIFTFERVAAERVARRVSDIKLIALAKALNVSASWLLFGDKGEKR